MTAPGAARPRLPAIGWLVLVFALLSGGWLAYDGAHALLTGDYVTPASGAHAGGLGPWSRLFEAVGVDPRSTAVMALHLVQGLVWLACMAAFVTRASWSRAAMLTCAVAGLWYLPFGTLLCVVQIVLLSQPALAARR